MIRAGAFAGVALLAACAAPQAKRASAHGLDRHNAREAALLARYPQSVRREGDVLRVASRGGWLDYRDTDCERDVDACVRFTLDREWQNGRFVGIAVGYYEGGDYLVADTQSGHEYTGSPPIFSPSGGLFATAVHSDAYETSAEGIRIWATDFPMRNVRIVSQHALANPEALGWRGEACLQFTAIDGKAVLPEGPGRPRRTYYLVAAEPEWRLRDALDAACGD